jgi:uncharacterized protein
MAGAKKKPLLRIKCKGVVKGVAEGEALVMKKSFSFMGDINMNTSEIIAKGHEHFGKKICQKILIYPETKGSSGGCIVLIALSKIGKQPAAIINLKMADYNLVEGAILANIPIACKPEKDPSTVISTGDRIRLDGEKGYIELLERRK